eukprot:1137257-Pelagomonas_calceolata.AAC.4
MMCAKARVAGAQLVGMFAICSMDKTRYITIEKGKIQAVPCTLSLQGPSLYSLTAQGCEEHHSRFRPSCQDAEDFIWMRPCTWGSAEIARWCSGCKTMPLPG